MALSGNLRDFSLPDVFQLISFSRKTGTLAIDRGDAKGYVYFKDGDVFFAVSNWNREPMGRRLVRAEKVTDRQLKRALELQTSDAESRRLGEILVEEGFLSPKVLETFVQEQIQDTIFDLFRWDQGEFDFKAGVIPTEEDIGLSVSVENIIMEGSRRLEEWSRIRKKVPHEHAIFRMAVAPGEGTFEISLKPSEWKLLCLLDGRRDIARLSELLDMSDFEVSRVLYGMFSGGLLERVNGDGTAVAATEEAALVEDEEAAVVQAEPEEESAGAEVSTEQVEETAEPPEVTPAEGAQTPSVDMAAAEEVMLDEIVESAASPGDVPEGVTSETVPTEVVSEPAADEALEELAEAVFGDEAVGETELEEAPTVTTSTAEAASAGPAVEVEEPVAAAPEEEELEEALLQGSLEEEDEGLEVGEFDLTDELAALTGTTEGKPKSAGAKSRQTAPAAEVPLHVDKRVDKQLLLKIIEGVKKL